MPLTLRSPPQSTPSCSTCRAAMGHHEYQNSTTLGRSIPVYAAGRARSAPLPVYLYEQSGLPVAALRSLFATWSQRASHRYWSLLRQWLGPPPAPLLDAGRRSRQPRDNPIGLGWNECWNPPCRSPRARAPEPQGSRPGQAPATPVLFARLPCPDPPRAPAGRKEAARQGEPHGQVPPPVMALAQPARVCRGLDIPYTVPGRSRCDPHSTRPPLGARVRP
eukprot:scaffold149_cov383-Prasinococcus_capsulatus_cf.AAC.20